MMTCLILAPATATWAPRSLFLIHRNGDTAAGFSRYWRPLVNEGWTLIVPQSTRACPGGGGGFCWEETDAALRELRGHLEECHRKRGLGADGMIVAGAGEAARFALEIAAESGLPWLCVAPFLPAPFDARALTAVPSHTRGAFLLGGHGSDRAPGDQRASRDQRPPERDPRDARAPFDHTRALIRDLESSGVDVTVRVMEGAGDELPEDFGRIAAEVLRPLIGDPALP